MQDVGLIVSFMRSVHHVSVCVSVHAITLQQTKPDSEVDLAAGTCIFGEKVTDQGHTQS